MTSEHGTTHLAKTVSNGEASGVFPRLVMGCVEFLSNFEVKPLMYTFTVFARGLLSAGHWTRGQGFGYHCEKTGPAPVALWRGWRT